MIEYIKGDIAVLNPAEVIIDTASGLGYQVNISLATFADLEGKSQAKLLIHESIREDAWTLYGFSTERERAMFRALIGVSGVGASSARVILSSIPTAELEAVIVNGEAGRLKAVKGIGQKTAQRIIVDLRDKIKIGEATAVGDLPLMNATEKSDVFEEALAALVILGFQRQASQKVLKKLFDADPAIKVDVAIKQALAML